MCDESLFNLADLIHASSRILPPLAEGQYAFSEPMRFRPPRYSLSKPEMRFDTPVLGRRTAFPPTSAACAESPDESAYGLPRTRLLDYRRTVILDQFLLSAPTPLDAKVLEDRHRCSSSAKFTGANDTPRILVMHSDNPQMRSSESTFSRLKTRSKYLVPIAAGSRGPWPPAISRNTRIGSIVNSTLCTGVGPQ